MRACLSAARRAGVFVVAPVVMMMALLLMFGLMPESVSAHPLSGSNGTVTISPDSGPVGARLTVSGEQFRSNDPIQIGYTTSDCSTMTTINGATGNSGPRGSFSIAVTWPMTGQGSFTVCAQDTATGKTYPSPNPYQVLSSAAPSLTISPSPAGSQGTVTVTGANFLPGGGSVEVLWGPQAAASGGAARTDICANSVWNHTSDSSGKFQFTFTAPYATNNMPITVIAVSPAGSCGHNPVLSAQQNLTVQPSAVATQTASAKATPGSKSNFAIPTWPPTGIWSVVYCLVGLLLFLLLLLALLVASRNRNKNQPAVVSANRASNRAGQGGQGNRLMGSTRVTYGSDGRPNASEQMYTQDRRGGSTQVADMGGGEDMPPLQGGSGGSGRSSRY